MNNKEILLLKRYCVSQGTTWDEMIESFCIERLESAKTWARSQKEETIDDLIANTETTEV